MTVAAGRRIVVAGEQRLPMSAVLETLRLPRMAQTAVHRNHRLVIVRMLGRDVRMATDAVVGLVSGQFQLGDIHEQRDRLAGGICFCERVVAVTVRQSLFFKPAKAGAIADTINARKIRKLRFISPCFSGTAIQDSPSLANFSPDIEK